MNNPTLKNRIEANYSSFDKTLNSATYNEGMAEVSALFPELIEAAPDQRRFEFQSIKDPDIYITIRKQATGWELTMVCIPGDEE